MALLTVAASPDEAHGASDPHGATHGPPTSADRSRGAAPSAEPPPADDGEATADPASGSPAAAPDSAPPSDDISDEPSGAPPDAPGTDAAAPGTDAATTGDASAPEGSDGAATGGDASAPEGSDGAATGGGATGSEGSGGAGTGGGATGSEGSGGAAAGGGVSGSEGSGGAAAGGGAGEADVVGPEEPGVTGAVTQAGVGGTAGDGAGASRRRGRWRRPTIEKPRPYGYLSRPLTPSARFLDHGVLQVAVAGGTPHLYRVELSLGLLDHLSLGVTAHWLPGESRPRVSPRIAIAFYRWRYVAVGATHHWTLYPPPVVDTDVKTPSYQQMAQWFLGTISFGQRFVSGGMDAGVVRAREDDPSKDPGDNLRNPSHIRVRFGGGVFVRLGTRRWGVTGQVLVPHLTAELAADVRFGLFERRPKGGWWPRDKPGRGGVQRRPWQHE